MIPYPNISPEIFRIGPIAIRWYGLMYAIGFASSYLLVKYQMQKKGQGSRGKGQEDKGQGAKGKGRKDRSTVVEYPQGFLDSLYTYLVLGLLIGARLGYVLFYDLASYAKNPLEIFAVWHGGMSFHGGAIGCLAAGYLCCRKYRVDFWRAADLVVVTTPIGLGMGRLGNFINGELYGRVTDVPWAMIFPTGGPLPRHPSQLYEFALEGVALFVLFWFLKERKLAPGALSGLFIACYGLFRFFVEFFREPDVQLGFIAGPFTMGQLLSVFMALAGVALFILRKNARAA
jgi:phosphatidylglycerol:prolipoprotein diacylglycerol transferase